MSISLHTPSCCACCLQDSQKHFREVEANLKETKAKLKQSEQALADVTAGRPASEQKQAELAQQLQSAQQSNDQLTSSNTDLSQQLADAKSVKSHVQDNSQAVQQQLQAAKQQHVQMQEANTKLSQQLEQASSRKSAAMEELAKKKDEVADLSEELQVAHKRVEILEADYDRVNKHLQVCDAIDEVMLSTKCQRCHVQFSCKCLCVACLHDTSTFSWLTDLQWRLP